MKQTMLQADKGLEEFFNLNESDQALLELASFHYRPVTQDSLVSIFNKYASGTRLKKLQGFGSLNRLEKAGLLTRIGNVIRCRPDLVEDVSTHAANHGRAKQMCRSFPTTPATRGSYLNDQRDHFASARRSLYVGDAKAFLRGRDYSRGFFMYAFEQGLREPEDSSDYFQKLVRGMATIAPLDFYPKDFSLQLVHEVLIDGLLNGENFDLCSLWLEQFAKKEGTQGIYPILFEKYLAQGNRLRVDEMLKGNPIPELLWCRAISQGQEPDPSVVPSYQASVLQYPLLGFLFSMACLKRDDSKGFKACLSQASEGASILFRILQEIIEGDAEKSLHELLDSLEEMTPDPLFAFMISCLLFWGGFRKELGEFNLAETAQLYQRSGHLFLAGEFKALAEIAQGSEQTTPFLAQIRRREPWELLLSGLERLEPRSQTEQTPAQRIVWELNLDRVNPLKLKVQKWGKKGDWTSGRKIELEDLRRFYPHDMDEHDKRVFERWVVSVYRGRRETGQLILALVGHPHVIDYQGRSVRLSPGSPEVTLKSSKEHFQVQSSLLCAHGIAYRKLSPTHYEVMELDQRLRELLSLFSRNQGVEVPKQELQKVAQSLQRHATTNLRVSSDINLGDSEETVAAPTDLVLRLTPAGQGLCILALVAPTGEGGPCYAPGNGQSFLLVQEGQKSVTYQRDLKRELKKWKTLREQVPHLTKPEQVVEEPMHCLELLEGLSQVKSPDFRIEWPEGVKFRLKKRMGWKDFGLSVRRKKDWLEVDGQLQLSETECWSMVQLLERHREQKNRFIPLGDGEFLALSEEFHRRLDALKRAAKKQNGASLELDPLSGSVLLEDSRLVDTDEFWQTLQERVEKSRKFVPELPSNLQATLRPYQEEGFRWLAGSAVRGIGCCLADDMGVGKTVQALALVLSRAKAKGKPTLVVAPTSVCFNWMEEVQRFTPDLRAKLFSQLDRETALQGLGGMDVVICSYGLLVNEIEKFQKVNWSNLIIDESQAIKNPTTKRFKAAISLNADFRLATTGTPIENRIDEIWAFFRFLNPGLLGSRQSFDKTYSGLDEMEEKRESLRRLLSPFILRRLKSQVLKDLPSRTDVNLTVEMTKEEKLQYESLRVHALERLEKAEKSDAVSILAELTRLRLACCHPRLVDPGTELKGAKLKVLIRLLQDLKDSGHRALVFSQFVGHLAIVREELDRRGLSYLYLDGSTPAKIRGTLVNKFQKGEQDFFLISLMAGGTGLNLTAANYVVHLDPWWNPAVEDQASDRAHRIGQSQPVTVYRLITKGTIEEKILELHKDKRELADTLLSGTDQAGKLSAEELLNLMRESVVSA